MNDHLKHILCFIRSEISVYLTEIPELSAKCIYSVVNACELSTNGMLHFILSDIKALEYDKLVIMTS